MVIGLGHASIAVRNRPTCRQTLPALDHRPETGPDSLRPRREDAFTDKLVDRSREVVRHAGDELDRHAESIPLCIARSTDATELEGRSHRSGHPEHNKPTGRRPNRRWSSGHGSRRTFRPTGPTARMNAGVCCCWSRPSWSMPIPRARRCSSTAGSPSCAGGVPVRIRSGHAATVIASTAAVWARDTADAHYCLVCPSDAKDSDGFEPSDASIRCMPRQRAAAPVFELDERWATRRGRDGFVAARQGLQLRLLVGADDVLAGMQQPSFEAARVQIQHATGLRLEVRVARKDPRALLPRLQRAVMQPAPDRRCRRLSDALLDDQPMQLSAREASQRTVVLGRQLARDRDDLGDLLRGENGAGGPRVACRSTPRCRARRIFVATC